MKFQKILMAVASAAMTFGPVASTSVFAKTLNPAAPDTQSTTLNYRVGSHYQWEIHTDIDFDHDKGVNKTVDGKVTDGSDQKVKVTENVIEEGKKLHITAAGSGTDGAFSIKNGEHGTEVLPYAVKSGENAVKVNGTVLDVNAGTNTGETKMGFQLSTTTKSAEVAGNYTGQITYSSSVVDQADQE